MDNADNLENMLNLMNCNMSRLDAANFQIAICLQVKEISAAAKFIHSLKCRSNYHFTEALA